MAETPRRRREHSFAPRLPRPEPARSPARPARSSAPEHRSGSPSRRRGGAASPALGLPYAAGPAVSLHATPAQIARLERTSDMTLGDVLKQLSGLEIGALLQELQAMAASSRADLLELADNAVFHRYDIHEERILTAIAAVLLRGNLDRDAFRAQFKVLLDRVPAHQVEVILAHLGLPRGTALARPIEPGDVHTEGDKNYLVLADQVRVKSPTNPSPAWRNHNPGNITVDKEHPQAWDLGAIRGKATGRFAIFPDFAAGKRGAMEWARRHAEKVPSATFLSYFGIFAPASEPGNHPDVYADGVARRLNSKLPEGAPRFHRDSLLKRVVDLGLLGDFVEAQKEEEGWVEGDAFGRSDSRLPAGLRRRIVAADDLARLNAAAAMQLEAQRRDAERGQPSVQPKRISEPAVQHQRQSGVTVAPANGPAEREADQVAEQVAAPAAPAVQTCPECGGTCTCGGAGGESSEEMPVLQRLPAPAAPAAGTGGALSGTVGQALAGAGHGEALRPSLRHRLERHLGTDLSPVRVHSGGSSVQAARTLGARAFTLGRDIWLGAGEAPDDLRLMAHETTHVVQQGQASPVQEKCAACEAEEASGGEEPVQLWDCSEYTEPTCVQTQKEDDAERPVQAKCTACEAEDQVQHAGAPARSPHAIHRAARGGLQGASQPLPHGARIQAAFGRHDVSQVRTNIGGTAAVANRRMGSLAFASGDRIGFREAPSLRLAAHEAAHVVQQHEGLSLPGNVGRTGDRWERHADRVADAVVAGRSAEPVLDEIARPDAPSSEGAERGEEAPPVQQQITSGASRLFEPPPAAPEVPASTSEAAAPPTAAGAGAAPAGPAEEGSALDAAAEGDSEAPPEGITTAAASSPASAGAPAPAAAPASGAGPSPAAAAPASTAPSPTPAAGGQAPGPSTQEGRQSGGGVSGPCYNVDPPPRPENAAEPSSDTQGAESQAEPQVTFEAWPAEVDACPAEATVAQAGQQMPEGMGEGAAGAAPAGGEAQAMSGAAAAAPGEPGLAEASRMEGQIAIATSERDTAVTDYLAAMDGLGEVTARSQSLGPGVTFPSAEGLQQAEARQAAIDTTRAFMSRATAQIAAAVAFAREQVPGRLGGLAEATKGGIQGAIETEKAAISARISQARTQARAGAAAARAHVHSEYANSAAQIEDSTLAALSALDTEHETSLGLVDDKETTGLGDVDSRFAAGRTQHEAKGPEYAARAITRGQEHAHAYEHCKRGYRDDGFWDGCLTVRRAKAQQDAACKTAGGYKTVFLRTANKKGYDLRELRKQYRCAVIAGARQVHQTLDTTHDQLVSGLEYGRAQALAGIALARDQNIAAIDNALAATLRSLAAQEFSQRQAVNDTGYLKQVAVEQLAHSSAANLARGISAAMGSLEQTLTTLREGFAQGGIPEPEALAQSLATAEAALGGGMGTLLDTMEAGAQQAEASLGSLGAAALDALGLLTTSNDETTAQAESGFAGQMDGLQSGASQTFAQLTGNHVQQAQEAMTQGTASMQQAVAGFDQALATIGGRVDGAIATSLQELDRDLGTKLGELGGQITREAWKAAEKEQPAWKSVVAIVLVILVIIAAAVISIVTLGAGASLFAVILVGALVGAVSGGLIQLINNWASGEAWHTGLAQAMIMGAIGGAIGGGLGFAGGALSAGAAAAGARVATQLAITVGADLVSEGLTQTIGYFAFGQEFNWQGFVMAGAMSGVSFRAHPSTPHPPASHAPTSHGPAPHAGAPHAEAPHAPAPHAEAPSIPPPSPSAGAAGGRRAAVTQIAGGAALGLGIEYVTAKISGKEFDLSQAASAAASGAVGARTSRMGHGTAPRSEPTPTTRFGRALERFRSFDPGRTAERPGVGARLGEYLEGVGARRFGARPETELPTGARARSEDAAGRPVEEAEATRARPAEEPLPTRPPEEGVEPGTGPRRDEATARETEGDGARRRGDELPIDTPSGRQTAHGEAVVGRGVDITIGGEPHSITIRRMGDRLLMMLCSNQCGEFILKVRRLQRGVELDSPAWRDLEALAIRALAADATINGVTPRSTEQEIANANTALNGLRDNMLLIETHHSGLVDPDVPVAGATQRATPSGRRVRMEDHLPAGVDRVGNPVTLNLAGGVPELPVQLRNLPRDVDFVYVLRDNITGEILKVGETADIATRARDYESTARLHAMGRSVSMEIQPVRAGSPEFPDTRSIETALRNSVEAGIAAERAGVEVPQRMPPLPWDATPITLPGGQRISRLVPHGEPEGQGTPGTYDPRRGTRARPPTADEPPLQPGESYWYRERKWDVSGYPHPPAHIPEWSPPQFAQRFTPAPTTPDELHRALGRMLADPRYQYRGRPSVRSVERALGVGNKTIADYLQRAGVTADDLMNLGGSR